MCVRLLAKVFLPVRQVKRDATVLLSEASDVSIERDHFDAVIGK
jgi:hypothetical protein